MAKQLSMGQIDSILTLHNSGHSNRKIAELLDVNRETVAKYVAQAAQSAADPAKPDHRVRPGPANACEPFRELIVSKLEQGLDGQRIYQDLRDDEEGFTASYSSVRRFLATLRETQPLPVRRIETLAGEEAQVDFGTGAWVISDGKRRRPWVLRVVLSHSRKAYCEAVWRQSTDAFIQCLENAFAHFGGVPKRLVIDNLKAAVARADWYDPEVHPKLQFEKRTVIVWIDERNGFGFKSAFATYLAGLGYQNRAPSIQNFMPPTILSFEAMKGAL